MALIISALLIMTPVILALIGSTHTTFEANLYPPKITPGSAGITNYIRAWDFGLGRMMLNTIFVAAVVSVGKIVLSLLAALAFVYFDFRFKSLIFVFILITMMFPTPVRIVALYDLVESLKMGDSYLALTAPYLASATGIFLFRQHFRSIPSSLADAARVDGAGPLRFLAYILIPMSMSAIGALAMIQFIYMWNQYLWPLIIISSEEKQLIQLGLRMLMQDLAGEQEWGLAMAGVVISLLPPLFIFILLQGQFRKGYALAEEK